MPKTKGLKDTNPRSRRKKTEKEKETTKAKKKKDEQNKQQRKIHENQVKKKDFVALFSGNPRGHAADNDDDNDDSTETEEDIEVEPAAHKESEDIQQQARHIQASLLLNVPTFQVPTWQEIVDEADIAADYDKEEAQFDLAIEDIRTQQQVSESSDDDQGSVMKLYLQAVQQQLRKEASDTTMNSVDK
jgi:hypothetical protein